MGSAWSRSTAGSKEPPDAEKPGLPIDEPAPQAEEELGPLPDELEQVVKKLPEDKQAKARSKIREFKDAIQPHTDEGGDAYYIGGAYDSVSRKCEAEWSKDVECGPYLTYLKEISEDLPHLEYLALWMLVGCAPPKWRFVKGEPDSRAKRVCRTKLSVVNFEGGKHTGTLPCNEKSELATFLQTAERDVPDVRLIIVEDLSRDVVELLGHHYDVDPLFFLSHIGDYLFHNPRDRWAELPNLEIDAREQSHFTLSYLRPRYFKTEADFEKAEYDSGMFNILRRLDSDRSRKSLQNGAFDSPMISVTLSRAKTSLWIKPRESNTGPMTAILLVDPTVSTGHPIWGGYRPFKGAPSMKDWKENKKAAMQAPKPGCSLYDSVVYWSERMTPEDLEIVAEDPKYIALPMYKLLAADWHATLKYMTAMFAMIEWSFERPHWGESPKDISELLKKLSPWRRNVGYYQTMVNDTITRLFPTIAAAYPSTPANLTVDVPAGTGIYKLWADIKNIKFQMDGHKLRIDSIQTMATNAINTEEARRAVKQNRNLARLTFLATIFIPLNFTSSFLSVSPDFPQATTTIWIFFVIGIPLTLTALIIVDLMHPEKKGFIRKMWRKKFPPKPNEKAAEQRPSSTEPGQTRTLTMGPKAYRRSDTSFFFKR